VVADLDRTVAWFVDGLGFINLFTVPDPSGQPVLVHLRRWQFQDLLVQPAAAPVSVGTSCVLNLAAVYDEIDTLAERARGHGGEQVGQPADTAWNTRELTTTDPDGNVVVFTAARPPQQTDHQFSAKIRQWNDEQVRTGERVPHGRVHAGVVAPGLRPLHGPARAAGRRRALAELARHGAGVAVAPARTQRRRGAPGHPAARCAARSQRLGLAPHRTQRLHEDHAGGENRA